jgi:RNA polymerase sigma-70 factor (ECF subfamily)
MLSAAESQWIGRAQQGDDKSFTYLVETYQRPVYNLCYRMLGNMEEAEDAAQETFLRAYKAIRRYDLSRSFLTWLLSIASHYCIDLIRRRRFQFISLEDYPGEMIQDDTPSPEAMAWRHEDQQQIQALLQSLSPTDRAAVVLYYWYDYSYEEIASTLALSNSAVKSRLHRARRQLAHNWQKQKGQALTKERTPYGSLVF